MLHWTVNLKGGSPSQWKGGKYAAAVSVEDKVYCFGGMCRNDNNGQIEVHIFNTVPLHWMKFRPMTTGREGSLEVPSVRRDHTAVLIEDAVYIWGGFPYCNVLYSFDVDAHRWFKPRIAGTVPGERERHSACVLGKVMYVHGGFRIRTGWKSDTYKLDTTTMAWSLINTGFGSPPGSYRLTSATIIGTKMFVFGTIAVGHSIHVFDTDTNRWLNTRYANHSPKQQWSHSTFAHNGELYILGGEYNLLTFSNLWKFNPETFSWKKIEPKGKGPYLPYQMRFDCCCMVGDCIIAFAEHTPDELYILDLSPSLKTLCKRAVIQCGLEQSELPHNIKWELAIGGQ